MSDREGPPEKRRKTLSTEVKLLEGAERSLLTEEDVQWSSEEMKGKELWLIQVPRDLDLSSLNNRQVELKGTEEINLGSPEESKTYSITSHPVSTQKNLKQTQTLPIVLLPSTKPGRLTDGPRFAGHACIFRSVPVSAIDSPSPPEDGVIHEVPQGLQQRWKPFGWKDPKSTNELPSPKAKRKHKKRSRKSRASEGL